MARTTFHNERKKVVCPGCRGAQVEPTGPVECIKWVDQAPARCRTCGRTWMTQNTVLLGIARQRFGEAA